MDGKAVATTVWSSAASISINSSMANDSRSGRGSGAGASPGGFPRPLLLRTLDVNGDGILDAEEIANAPAALRKLDKNGDGKLTPDEYRDAGAPSGGPPPR